MIQSILQRLATALQRVSALQVSVRSAIGRHALWLTAACYAILAESHKHTFFSDTWWFVYIPVWTIAVQKSPHATGRLTRWGITLTALILFAWLFFKTQIAAHEAFATWQFWSHSLWAHRVSLLLQAVLCGAVGAVAIATPIKRIVGIQIISAPLLVCLPYAALGAPSCLLSISQSPENWIATSVLFADLMLPVLILAVVYNWLSNTDSKSSAGYEKVSPNFAFRMLRGELNSRTNFFGVFVPSVILTAIGLHQKSHLSTSLFSSSLGYATKVLLFALYFSTLVFATVSVWASLTRLKRKDRLAANIAELGQIIVLMTAAPLLLYLVFFDIPETAHDLREGLRVAPGRAWSVVVDGNLLRITGELSFGIGEAVASAVANTPALQVVVLDSPGGSIDEGMHIAESIKSHRLSTAVKNRCSSACVYVFVAGRERILLPTTKLGFHACHEMVWYEDCRNERYEKYFVTNGIDRDFVQRGMSVPPDKIWYPTVEELIAAHVVTRTTKPTSENGDSDMHKPATTAAISIKDQNALRQ